MGKQLSTGRNDVSSKLASYRNPDSKAYNAILISKPPAQDAAPIAIPGYDAVPIANLPVEVWNQIFELGPRETLRDINDYANTNAPASVPFHVAVTHVCRRWREIAAQNPFLWTRVAVDFSRSTRLARLYLERSRNAELDIRVLIRHEAQVKSFASMLLADMKRCRDLNMSFRGYRAAFTAFHSLQQASVPVLRVCKMVVESDMIHFEHGAAFAPPSWLFAGGTPMLSSLRLNGISALGCRIHLHTVTHLELKVDLFARQLSFKDASSILLEASPILTHLTLDGYVISHLLGIQTPSLKLPALTSLDLCLPFARNGPRHHDVLSQHYIPFLWQFLRVPSLERLSLFNLSEVQLHDTAVAVGQQRVSGHAGVTHLSLDGIGIRGTLNTEDLTFLCPNIVELKIRGEHHRRW